MSQVLFLVPLSIGMGLIGLGAFIWALRHDQFDDPEGNAWRVLLAEERQQNECGSDVERICGAGEP